MKRKGLEVIIDLKKKGDFVSRYNNNTLDSKLKEYIINELVGYSTESKVTITVNSAFELTEEEKEHYVKILKKEFKEDLDEEKYLTKKNKIKEIYSAVVGTLFILASYFMNLDILGVLKEIILIVGWVLIWEVAYSIIFTNGKRKISLRRLKQISNCKIEFK